MLIEIIKLGLDLGWAFVSKCSERKRGLSGFRSSLTRDNLANAQAERSGAEKAAGG